MIKKTFKGIICLILCLCMLPAFAANAEETEMNVVFIGGSITYGTGATANEKCYASLVGNYLKKANPDKKVNIFNAGLPGTGSDLGLFRLKRDVLSHKPDMVFVEFAINDKDRGRNDPQSVIKSMEGIVRLLLREEKKPIINFIYTTNINFQACTDVHNKVANYYGIPAHDIQAYIKKLNKADSSTIKNILSDTVHPNDKGHSIYANYIIGNLKNHKEEYFKQAREMKNPLSGHEVYSPEFVSPNEAKLSSGWSQDECANEKYYLSSGVGDKLEYEFYGSSFGIADIWGKTYGTAQYVIDDKISGTIYTTNPASDGYVNSFIRMDLEEKWHKIVITNNSKNPAISNIGIVALLVDEGNQTPRPEKEQVKNVNYGESFISLINRVTAIVPGSNYIFVNGEKIKCGAIVEETDSDVLIPKEAASYLGKNEDTLLSGIDKKILKDKSGIIFIGDEDISMSKADEADAEKFVLLFGVYVSQNGNDEGNGTIKSPFKTFEKARDTVRGLKGNDNVSWNDTTVYIRGGVYSRDNSFELLKEDSGTEKAPVTYTAYNGENVSINGAKQIDTSLFAKIESESVLSRLPYAARDKVMQLDMQKAGITDFGLNTNENGNIPSAPELSFDGQMMTLARWPDNGFALTGKVLDNSQQKGATFGYIGDEPGKWKNTDDVWLRGYWFFNWADQAVKLNKTDAENQRFNTTFINGYGVARDRMYYAYNILEELSSPGEWYLDRQNAVLYFYPPKSMTNKTMMFSSMTDPIISANAASNIRFENLTFESARGIGIKLNNTRQMLIEKCVIKNIGQQAVTVTGSGNGIRDCYIHDIGKGGVYITGGDFTNLTSSGNYIENCRFERFSRIARTYTPAAKLYGVGDRISHCTINNAPHMAIYFMGNNNVIEYNDIYDVMQESLDSGAIYGGRDFTSCGNVVRYNKIHDCYGLDADKKDNPSEISVHGLYLDDSIGSMDIYGNTFYNLASGIFIHTGRSNRIYGNVFDNCYTSIDIINRSNGTRENMDKLNAQYKNPPANWNDTLYVRYMAAPIGNETWSKSYPQLKEILTDDPIYPKYNTVEKNIVGNSGKINMSDVAFEFGTLKDNIELAESLKFDENHTLAKEYEGFETADMSTVGCMGEKQISDFELKLPIRNATGIEARKTEFAWQPASNACKYRLVIAKDAKFNNVIHDSIVNGTYKTVKNLRYEKTKYYWKVCALKEDGTGKWNSGEASFFRTLPKETIVTKYLEDKLELCIAEYDGAVESDEAGMFVTGSKELFLKSLDEAKQVLKNCKTQSQIDEALEKLTAAENKFTNSKNIETVDVGNMIADKENWAFPEGSTVFSESLKFDSETKDIGGYKKELENYQYLTFKAKLSVHDAHWQGFAFKSTTFDNYVYTGTNNGYMVVVKPDIIELQRFNSAKSTMLKIVDNTFINDADWHDIKLGAINTGNGVQLKFEVDGKTVFDMEDSENCLIDKGYFMIQGNKEPIEIASVK